MVVMTTANPYFALLTGRVGGSPVPELLWYKCNEGTGTTLGDSSTLGTSTGTLSSSSMWTTLDSFTCIKGNGTTFKANTSSTVAIGVNIVSVCFWLDDSTQTSTEVLIELTDATDTATKKFFGVYTITGPKVDGGIFGNSSSMAKSTTSSTSGWHHYIVILDGSVSSGQVTGYTDGSSATFNSEATGTPGTANYSTSTIYFLARAGTSIFSNAGLDDIRIYNRAVNSTEAAQIYNDRQ